MTYSSSMSSYVSARGRATAIVVLVIVQLVLVALAMLGWGWAAATLSGGDRIGALSAIGLATVFLVLDVMVWIAATVVFLTWVYRAIANLPALESLSCRFAPSWAVWGFFIPFYNLVHIYQVMATIWTDSQPAVINENGYALPRRATLVGWWWGLQIGAGVLSWLMPSHPHGLAEMREMAVWSVVQLALVLASGTLFLFMIRGAQRRQDEQALDLERRRNVPKPSADFLR